MKVIINTKDADPEVDKPIHFCELPELHSDVLKYTVIKTCKPQIILFAFSDGPNLPLLIPSEVMTICKNPHRKYLNQYRFLSIPSRVNLHLQIGKPTMVMHPLV